MKHVKWNNNKNDIKNTEKLLKNQNFKCANNPNNFVYVGPRDYVCPQLKYNNGLLEKDYENDFGYVFEIDFKDDLTKPLNQSFDNKQILCLYCFQKKNRRKLNLDINYFEAYNSRCKMDIC